LTYIKELDGLRQLLSHSMVLFSHFARQCVTFCATLRDFCNLTYQLLQRRDGRDSSGVAVGCRIHGRKVCVAKDFVRQRRDRGRISFGPQRFPADQQLAPQTVSNQLYTETTWTVGKGGGFFAAREFQVTCDFQPHGFPDLVNEAN
jgi:hypothetical protein